LDFINNQRPAVCFQKQFWILDGKIAVLGPYNTMQGNDLLTSRIMDSLLRSTYMLISPFSIKNALRCHFHRNAIITYFSDEINIAMSFSSKIKMYPLFRIVQQ